MNPHRPNLYTTEHNIEKRARQLADAEGETWPIYVFAGLAGLTVACWIWAIFF